jgi:hypothetical protein
VFAAVFVGTATGSFTENSAFREIVWLDKESVANTSNEYFPGVSVPSGNSRSIVT